MCMLCVAQKEGGMTRMKEKEKEAVWEEAAMLAPRRD